MSRTRGKKEEFRYRRNEHCKACCILITQTCRKLKLGLEDVHEVFRLAYACSGGYTEEVASDAFAKWIEDVHKRPLPDVVENFCLDILSNRITWLGKKKAKKRLPPPHNID